MELTIEKLVYGGDGLARPEGEVLLVPYVLPGERVSVRPGGLRHGVRRASLETVESPAAGRVEPPCPYFGRCGGCHYQHAAYQLQVQQKLAILVETLIRGGVRQEFPLSYLSGEPWGYRNRVQFHVDKGRIGYRESRSHRTVPVEQCPIASPHINQTMGVLREMMRDRRWPRFLRSFELFTNEQETQFNALDSDRPLAKRFFEWCAERIPGAASASLDYTVGPDVYRVSNQSFFQVNRLLLESLVTEAIGEAGGAHALDLYAGVGLFTLPLARRFTRVTAVESGRGASRDLTHNAKRAGLAVEVALGHVEPFLAAFAGPAPNFVLADPPRTGLGSAVAGRLKEIGPARLTIISCDPSTLARDLCQLEGYRIARATMVDLFPQTYHIESISIFEK